MKPENSILKRVAHIVSNEKWRSNDIKFDDTKFSDFNLNPDLLIGLNKCGFFKPSEIQTRAIPYGRLGLDLFVQSKSGTGKTCVFAVIVLDTIDLSLNSCQCLILVPTREIASQIHKVFKSIGSSMKGLNVKKFTGGSGVKIDITFLKKCHIAIGTPGRIKYLIDSNNLKTNSIRTLILDEADKLFDDNFTDQIKQINYQLLKSKQIILTTATSNKNLNAFMQKNMRNAKHIKIHYDRMSLIGVDQYYWNLGLQLDTNLEEKLLENVLFILKNVSFTQCIIFSNKETRTELLKPKLIEFGWSTEVICGKYLQYIRDRIIKNMNDLKIKILLCTDLISRGIDCENVNLIINLDLPNDLATYLHRVGRCGRFGQHGIAISLCSNTSDFENLNIIKNYLDDDLKELPDLNSINDLWSFNNKIKSNSNIITIDDLLYTKEPNPNSEYLSFNQVLDLYNEFTNNYE